MQDGVLDREEALGGVGQGALARNMLLPPPGGGGLGGVWGGPKIDQKWPKMPFFGKKPPKMVKIGHFRPKIPRFLGCFGGSRSHTHFVLRFFKVPRKPGFRMGARKSPANLDSL